MLVSARNPLNIGAAARAMCNFGFSQLRVVHPYDPAFRDARSAVGAARLLADAEEFQTVADAVADCSLVLGTVAAGHRHPQHISHPLAAGARLVQQVLQNASSETQRAAILFGSEKFGLSNKDLGHCHAILHIPTQAEQPSMNLGQAVAVCLYELVRDDAAKPIGETPDAASSGNLERATDILLDALHTSGYMEKLSGEDKDVPIRRFVRRLNLCSDDATILLGMLRQILWKLRTKP